VSHEKYVLRRLLLSLHRTFFNFYFTIKFKNQEGMWYHLLDQMSLIDNIDVTTVSGQTTVTLDLVPLAQFRVGGARPGELYTSRWTHDGVVQTQLANQFQFTLPTSSATGSWSVTVQFTTPEILVDDDDVTVAIETFSV